MKVGIVVDNYKVRKFKRELKKNKFEIEKQLPFTPGVTIITIITDEDGKNRIGKICTKLEIDFKQSN